MVSAIMPTHERSDRHPTAYAWFARSLYPRRELLVFDDSSSPSPFFSRLNDPRVLYFYSPEKWSIGAKRNFLIGKAQGSILVHQDDDDAYAPAWIGAMVLRLRGADLVKLSVFNIIDERDGSTWQWDTRESGGAQKLLGAKRSLCLAVPFGIADTEVSRWGFGFSYVYQKSLYDCGVRFPNIDRREDYEFVKRAHGAGARLKQISDCSNLVWHSVHDRSVSTCFPQTRLDGPMPFPKASVVGGAGLGAGLGAALLGSPVAALAGAVVMADLVVSSLQAPRKKVVGMSSKNG